MADHITQDILNKNETAKKEIKKAKNVRQKKKMNDKQKN